MDSSPARRKVLNEKKASEAKKAQIWFFSLSRLQQEKSLHNSLPRQIFCLFLFFPNSFSARSSKSYVQKWHDLVHFIYNHWIIFYQSIWKWGKLLQEDFFPYSRVSRVTREKNMTLRFESLHCKECRNWTKKFRKICGQNLCGIFLANCSNVETPEWKKVSINFFA